MKNLFLLSLLAAFNISSTSVESPVHLFYTVSSLDNDSDEIKNLLFDNIIYSVTASDKVCIMKGTSSMNEIPGITSENENESSLYIDYIRGISFDDFGSETVTKFKDVGFILDKSYQGQMLGYDVKKYISKDENFIIYTTPQLPWYAQPCLMSNKTIPEGVVKFVNKKSKYEIMLTKRGENDKSTNDTAALETKILKKQYKYTTEKTTPFFE